MATYEELYKQMMQEAEKQHAAYAGERRKTADAAAKQVADGYAILDQTAREQYKQSAAETAAAYRAAYDANAVSEHIARKNAEEVMRRMGLENSGLSGTEQTAIALRRGRADSETTAAKVAAVEKLKADLDAYLAKNAAASADKQTKIFAEASADIAQNQETLRDDAADRALEWYKAELAAASKGSSSSSGNSGKNGNTDGGKNGNADSGKNGEEDNKDTTSQTPYVGSYLGSDRNRSATAVAVDTYMRWREGGDIAAMNYLNGHVNDGYITQEEKKKIMNTIGIRYVERVTGEQAIGVVARLDKEDAQTYLDGLLKTGMITTPNYIAAMKAAGLDPWS